MDFRNGSIEKRWLSNISVWFVFSRVLVLFINVGEEFIAVTISVVLRVSLWFLGGLIFIILILLD